MMNELDELVYSLEDLSLSEEKKVLMNRGETEGPQGKFEASTSMKNEWQEPQNENKNFTNKTRRNDDFSKNYHNNDKSRFMPNRLPTGDIGVQFLDLECKRNSENSLDLWSQNMLLYFLLREGNYTDEEKYFTMINTFMGKVNDWFLGLTEDAENIIKNDTLEGLENSLQEGISNLKQYVANEFFGGQGNEKENKEMIKNIAKE